MEKVRVWIGRTDQVKVHPLVERVLEPPRARWRPSWGRVAAWALVLVLALWAVAGCARVQTPSGPVYVIKAPEAVCSRVAQVLEADRVAWTAGHPLMCGSAAAADRCLVEHEKVHENEQAAYPGGPAKWIDDWLLEAWGCRKTGRTARECHDQHSMEQAAIKVQRACEAGGGA